MAMMPAATVFNSIDIAQSFPFLVSLISNAQGSMRSNPLVEKRSFLQFHWPPEAPDSDFEAGCSAFSVDPCLAQDEFPFAIMHTPRAHIAAQGATARSSGANPVATTQFQPRASPAPMMAIATMTNPRGLISQSWTRSALFRTGEIAACGECFPMSIAAMIQSPLNDDLGRHRLATRDSRRVMSDWFPSMAMESSHPILAKTGKVSSSQ